MILKICRITCCRKLTLHAKKKPDVLQVLVNSSSWPASRCHLLVMPTSAETQSAITFINKTTSLRSSYSTLMQIMHISHILIACRRICTYIIHQTPKDSQFGSQFMHATRKECFALQIY